MKSPRTVSVIALAVAVLATVAGILVPGTATAAPAVGRSVAAAAVLAPTSTTLTTARNPAYSAQSGAVIARVRGNAVLGVPTGSVDFYLDGQAWRTDVLDSMGRARLPYRDIPTGAHSITAAYSGDAAYDASSSAVLSQTVLATVPTAVMTYTPATVAPGAVSRLVLAATNNTPVGMPTMGMGLMLPPGAAIVAKPPGVGCRTVRPSLFYCVTSASPGTTRRIVVDVTAPGTPTTILTAGYARNLDTMEEAGATASLVVN